MSLLHVLVLSGVLEPPLTLEEIDDAWRRLPPARGSAPDGEPLAAAVMPGDDDRAAFVKGPS